jgi:NAD(P)-dependent dehydrogenase (short-subunit alcohol dehydrogenase family)
MKRFENKVAVVTGGNSGIGMSQAIETVLRRPRDQMHAYIQSNLQFIAGHPKEIRALGEIFLNLRRQSG